jgi:alkylhydroperoxidase family enzyme
MMARLPYADAEQLQAMLGRSPFPEDIHPGNVFRMLALAPDVGAAALGFIYALLTDSDLEPRLREIVILRAAQRSDAPYAFGQHAAIATSAGVPETQISSLQNGDVPDDLFDELERAALAFADEVLDCSHFSDATFVRTRECFSPRQVVELLLTAGCFRMMSRLVTLLELELEPSFGVQALQRAREPVIGA